MTTRGSARDLRAWSRRTAAGLVTGCLLLGLTGCGQSDADRAAEARAKASAAAKASASASASAAAAQEAKQKAREQRQWKACQKPMGPLLDALSEIDSRLGVGLTYSDLGDRLGTAKVAYDGIHFGQIDQKCIIGPGLQLENAYNEYVKSLTAWQKCVDSYSCDVSGDVLAGLRAHWSTAGRDIARAKHALSSPKAFAKVG